MQTRISVLQPEDYIDFVFELFFEIDIVNQGRFVAYLAYVYCLFKKFGFYVFF